VRVWFDADNAPHVLVMRPLAEELRRMGVDVVFTARRRSSTCELLDLFGLPYTVTGGPGGRGKASKALGILSRAASLAGFAWRSGASVSFGHGSRSLPLASRLAGIPTVTMYDYEWVEPAIFNRFCDIILLPEAVGPGGVRDAGISARKARFFPGLKEEMYLSRWSPDPTVSEALEPSGGRIRILLRPPAEKAHYFTRETADLYAGVLARLLPMRDVQIILIPREGCPVPAPPAGGAAVQVPGRALDGPSLVWLMDMVIGGGGTMTREAAVLGVPSVSFFRGRRGRVDTMLEQAGRLVMLEPGGAGAMNVARRKTEPSIPCREDLARSVCETILSAARNPSPKG